MRGLVAGALCAALLAGPAMAAGLRDAEIKDADTLAWWRIAEALSSDAMEGRDTGSAAYERAADWVAARFKAAGLKPAGENGTWFQTLALHDVKVEKDGTSFAILRGAEEVPLSFLHQITVRAADDLPGMVQGDLTFRGYCRAEDLADVRGKIVVCFNTRRTGLTTSGERLRNAQAAGAMGVVQVDDPGFTIEPARWPFAYSRAVSLAETPPPKGQIVAMTISAPAFAHLIKGSGQDAAAVLKAGGAKQPLKSFDIPAKLRARFVVSRRDYTTRNVLAVLPGRDARLKAEYVVIGAHLDGYGYGEPVGGDALYNGTLDDAAYVGTLIRFAERHKRRPLARSVLFGVWAGEEKGLLGSTHFARHPTIAPAQLVGNVNLDQLRPLFPLEVLSMLAVDESSLGATARAVAAPMGIGIQADPEPERGLLARSDHWPLMQIGVPATGFIFGYTPGTDAERRYREWYDVRYHRPQDDLTQPMDWPAAAKFNSFFYKLVETLGNAPERPTWTPGSRFAPK